jgi:hypothetical protein
MWPTCWLDWDEEVTIVPTRGKIDAFTSATLGQCLKTAMISHETQRHQKYARGHPMRSHDPGPYARVGPYLLRHRFSSHKQGHRAQCNGELGPMVYDLENLIHVEAFTQGVTRRRSGRVVLLRRRFFPDPALRWKDRSSDSSFLGAPRGFMLRLPVLRDISEEATFASPHRWLSGPGVHAICVSEETLAA